MAHEAWAWCLREGRDAWEATEQAWDLDADDLAAGQIYLDDARARIKAVPIEHKASVIVLIEEQFHAPAIHELAWGTVDLGLIAGFYCEITDYKHGEGIFVDAVDNPQLMGYACLALAKYPFIKQFKLRIMQPRCQYTGPREWEISAEDLLVWQRDVLKPAMQIASNTSLPRSRLIPGPWCRFCKAKEALACPALEQNALTVAQSHETPALLSDERLGELYGMIETLNMRIKAIKDEAERRMLAGGTVPGVKTVAKKADRLWKDTAQAALVAAVGPDVLSTGLKSPAVVEKLNPRAKALVAEYAYTPDYGLTIAPMSDRRKTVSVQGLDNKFQKLLDKPAPKA